MTDYEILNWLLNRGYGRWGLTIEQVISPDSQRILPLRVAAREAGLDPDADALPNEVLR